jgi:hypothetical protein
MKPKPHPIAWTRDSSPSSLYVYPLTTQRPPLQPLSFSSHVRLSYPRFPSDLDTCLSTLPTLCITNITPLGHRSRYVGAGRAVLCELSWPYQRPRVLPTYALTATSPPPSLPEQNPHPSRRYHLSTGRPRRQQRSDCMRESWSPRLQRRRPAGCSSPTPALPLTPRPASESCAAQLHVRRPAPSRMKVVGADNSPPRYVFCVSLLSDVVYAVLFGPGAVLHATPYAVPSGLSTSR